MTRARASSPTSWPGRWSWSSATRAATTPATPSWSTARPSPSSWCRAASSTPTSPRSSATAWWSTRPCSWPRSTSSSPRASTPSKLLVSGNAHLIMPYHHELDQLAERYLGKNKLGHHQAGHRPGLRRQVVPGRAAGPGPPRPQDLPPEARRGAEGEEPGPGQGVQPAARCRPTTSATSTSTSSPPGSPRWWPTRWASSTTRSSAAPTCCSRGPRPPSSTSTTAPTPSSPRPTRWPAVPAPAPASAPATSTRSSASPRPT